MTGSARIKHSFNRDDARYMRHVLKMPIAEICKHLGENLGEKSYKAVQKACAVETPQTRALKALAAKNREMLALYNEARTKERLLKTEDISRLCDRGLSCKEIANQSGYSTRSVSRILKELGKTIHLAALKTKAEPRGRTIPEWVRKADLVQDYRDIMRTRGEHAAASHCRALKAEAQRPCA
jgi:AraC-like DNA-binding protein